MTDRDVMEYDVVIVGAGPAGLACAIRLKQLKPDTNVCVLEKASADRRALALRRACIEPGPLDELLPDWRSASADICVPATQRRILAADADRRAASCRLPPQMHNHGNFIVSLGQLAPWLAQQAEALGVDIFPGFAAAEALYRRDGAVTGVRIGDMGLDKDGTPGPELHAGRRHPRARRPCSPRAARGSLTKQLIAQFELDARAAIRRPTGSASRSCGSCRRAACKPGRIEHTLRLAARLAHLRRQLPLSPRPGSRVRRLRRRARLRGSALQAVRGVPAVQEPSAIKPLLEGGEILAAGARAIAPAAGSRCRSWKCRARCSIGDAAGTLNVPKIKGMHQAIRSRRARRRAPRARPARPRASTRAGAPREGGRELQRGAQLQAGFQARPVVRPCSTRHRDGRPRATSPWTLHNKADWSALRKARRVRRRRTATGSSASLPPRDRLASVFFAGNVHDEDQPVHLQGRGHVRSASTRCTKEYGNPCENFCPAGVYEMVDDGAGGTAPADQRRELRALQGLRHQGSVRDHHLDDAGRRLRARTTRSSR